jgi:hypothetical protein
MFSAAEIGFYESWNQSLMACVIVGNERHFLESTLQTIVKAIETRFQGFTILDRENRILVRTRNGSILKDKIILITGSSSGLGFATAELLVQEGAIVIINGRDKKRLSDAKERLDAIPNAQVIAMAGDVSTADFATKVVNEIEYHFDGLDILITNAGGPPAGSLDDFSDEVWQNAINSTFLSHLRLIRLPSLC